MKRLLVCLLLESVFVLVVLGIHSNALSQVASPKVETHVLQTTDGVLLNIKFYPGTKGKGSVPIIMLHSMLNTRVDNASYKDMALYLQQELGAAIIVPDLRGFGESVERLNPENLNMPLRIDREKFNKDDFISVFFDIEACKKFLLDKNNGGELNIEKLVVVGSDITSIVAMNWAAYDWNVRGSVLLRQGQDVKALILLTPMLGYKGLVPTAGLNHPIIRSKCNIMIIAGEKNRKYYDQSHRLYKILARHHPIPNKADVEVNWQARRLFEFGLPTDRQGSAILSVPNLQPNPKALFVDFIKWRLVNDRTLEWNRRPLLKDVLK